MNKNAFYANGLHRVHSDQDAVARADSGVHAAGAGATVSPTSNTGEPAGSVGGHAEPISRSYSKLVVQKGKLVEIPLKVGNGTAGVIDTLTVTMSESIFIRPDQLGTEEDIAGNISAELEEIFGFGLSIKMNGRNGYLHSYQMGGEGANYGFAAMGGKRQRETVCLHLTGQGLIAALNGWEHRLYNFLQAYAPAAKITRCDVAHDFFEGEYTPDMALKDWEEGGFTSSHTAPIGECYGSDWLRNEGRGKTFYVGSRKNSPRFVRVYEKGKEQGDPESKWCRVELEMHNRSMIIPHEILIEPGKFLTGAYPVFQRLFREFDEAPKKPELVKKLSEVGLEHCVKYASMQVSPTIKLLQNLGLNSDEILDVLFNPAAEFPKRVSPAHFDCKESNGIYIHHIIKPPLSEEALLNKLEDDLNQERIHRYPVQPTKEQAYFRRLQRILPSKVNLNFSTT